jgi:hypothetical protein
MKPRVTDVQTKSHPLFAAQAYPMATETAFVVIVIGVIIVAFVAFVARCCSCECWVDKPGPFFPSNAL